MLEPKTQIKVMFGAGVAIGINSPLEVSEIRREINTARKEGRFAEIKSVSDVAFVNLSDVKLVTVEDFKPATGLVIATPTPPKLTLDASGKIKDA